MATKQAKKLATIQNNFTRWRIQCGLTQAGAAKPLGLSKRQVQIYDSGVSPMTGKPIAPPLAVRKVMAAISKNVDLEPWPE